MAVLYHTLLVLLLGNLVSASNNTHGCKLNVPQDVQDQMEAKGNPLQVHITIKVSRLRDVPASGGSYGVDFIMYLAWRDERYIKANRHRETECTSQRVLWTRRDEFWIPNIHVAEALELEFSTSVITDHATKNHTEKFDLSFKQLEQVNWIGDGGEFSVGGFTVELARSPSPFYTNTFMPTFMVTVTSFLGFVIPVEMVPGRMALLVTIYLMLINIKSSEQNLGPETRSATALDIWLHICATFVQLAMLEYAVLLRLKFGCKIMNHGRKKNINRTEERCNRIDHYAMMIFPTIFGLTTFAYFYVLI